MIIELVQVAIQLVFSPTESLITIQIFRGFEFTFVKGYPIQDQLFKYRIFDLIKTNLVKKPAKRRKCCRRSGIEAIIGHLKTDHRLGQNYLHGQQSPQINAMLAAAGWNLKKWMQQAGKKIKNAISRWIEWFQPFAYFAIN